MRILPTPMKVRGEYFYKRRTLSIAYAMETLSATTIFWLISLGAITGWTVGYAMGNEGITRTSNLIWGIAGSLVIGIIALLLQLMGAFLYAFLGTLATLFLANVFHLHHVEDILNDVRRDIRIIKPKK